MSVLIRLLTISYTIIFNETIYFIHYTFYITNLVGRIFDFSKKFDFCVAKGEAHNGDHEADYKLVSNRTLLNSKFEISYLDFHLHYHAHFYFFFFSLAWWIQFHFHFNLWTSLFFFLNSFFIDFTFIFLFVLCLEIRILRHIYF